MVILDITDVVRNLLLHNQDKFKAFSLACGVTKGGLTNVDTECGHILSRKRKNESRLIL